MDAVVVGGGIVGLASAHALADRGADVTLVERGAIGGESTQRAVGGIRTQFTTPVNVDLSLASLPVWASFEERFGVDIGFRRNGYLFLARDGDTASTLREAAAMQNERGGDTRVLDPDAATEYCPGVNEEEFCLGTYSPLDGFADPNLACRGYAEALPDLGVEVLTDTAVTDVRTRDGAVVGVETTAGDLDADVVVNATGPWAADLSAMAGVEVPVRPKRRQVLVVDPETPVPEDAPLTIDLDTGVYFRPERDGVAIAGGHFADADPDQDPAHYDEDYDVDWAVTCLERAADAASYFGPDARIRRGWAGLYAVTPDHHPILEESVPGFVQAVGFSGHGFQHAPATGRVVADLALDGDSERVDVSRLSSDRFEKGDLLEERNVA